MPLAVILDVDGTLVDNTYLHVLAWWRACREHGIAVKMAQLHHLVGMGGDQLVPALLGREVPGLDEAHSRYMRPHQEETPVLPGASDLIAELHRRDATVAIATSSGGSDLRIQLDKLPAAGLLDHVITGDDVGTTKPAPDLAALALRACGAEPESAVFVGDTPWDIEAAGRVGIPCVAVLSGGWSPAELLGRGAVEVHEDAAALLAGLENSFIGQRLRP